MDFSRTMLSLAMESGEVRQDVDLDNGVVDADELYEELLYAAEARSVELMNAVTFSESLHALTVSVEGVSFTQESFEQHQDKLKHLMLVHNFSIPVETMSASFEAAVADANAVKEKSTGVVAKVGAWIKEKWEAFIKALRRLRLIFKARGAKAKSDQTTLETKWKENVNNINPETFVKGTKAIPTVFITRGKFNAKTATDALGNYALSAERTNIMSYKDANGKLLLPGDWSSSADKIRSVGEALKKEIETERAKKHGEDFKKMFLQSEKSSDYEYRAKDIMAMTRWLTDRIEDYEKAVVTFDSITNDLERSLAADVKAMANDPSLAMALRSVTTRALVVANGITGLLSTEQSGHLAIHSVFKSMTGIKGLVEKKEDDK